MMAWKSFVSQSATPASRPRVLTTTFMCDLAALGGSGVVGSSFSLVFAPAGLDVVVYDPDLRFCGIRSALNDPNALKLASGGDRGNVLSHLKIAFSLEEALAGRTISRKVRQNGWT